jgi:hypothetical protein
MQKALRSQLLTRNSSAAKYRKSIFKTRYREEQDFQNASRIQSRIRRFNVRTERKNRREDWIAGELAGDRNTGMKKGVLGSAHMSALQTGYVPSHILDAPGGKDANLGQRKEWEGEGNLFNIVVGDRVAVVRGMEGVVGKVGLVEEVDFAKGELKVKGVNLISSSYARVGVVLTCDRPISESQNTCPNANGPIR